jgi:MoxR-like ATPase/intein/homing endonuclease/transcriptional regulator with XRE-family HTH domain
MVKSISQALGLSFKRIQFTPDLMPSDIVGTQILAESDHQRYFEFKKGPIFANIVLADEINRATPKAQSAVLEAMEEQQVTVFGETHKLTPPFFVLATQNPIELEGSLTLDQPVYTNGVLKTGQEIIAELCDERLYEPPYWTFSLNSEGWLVKAPCFPYFLDYAGDVFDVVTVTGRSIQVTANHPFAVCTNGEVGWKRAEELRVGDYLIVPAQLPEDCTPSPAVRSHGEVLQELATRYRVVRHEELVRLRDRLEKFSSFTGKEFDALRIASGLTVQELATRLGLDKRGYFRLVRFLRRDTASLATHAILADFFRRHFPDLTETRDYIEARGIVSLKRFSLDEDVAFWLAFVLADGSIGQDYVEACQRNFPQALEKFVSVSRDFMGLSGLRTQERDGCKYVRVGSRPLVEYICKRFALKPGKHKDNGIPAWVLSFPASLRRVFLQTFISLESHLDLRFRKIIFRQASRKSTNVIAHLLLQEGILPWLRFAPCSGRGIHTIKIQGSDFGKYLSRIGWLQPIPPVAKVESHSNLRVVPVRIAFVDTLLKLLGLRSFHTYPGRKAHSSTFWYQSLRTSRRRGSGMAQPFYEQMVADLAEEIDRRKELDVEALVQTDPRKAAVLCGLPMTEIASKVGVSHNTLWALYGRNRCRKKEQEIRRFIQSEYRERLGQAEQLLRYLKGFSTPAIFYDRVKRVTCQPYQGRVFGLTVPQLQNYLAGFGACGINHNTYPLPEAQMDRFFFKVVIHAPSPKELKTILDRTTYGTRYQIKEVLPAAEASHIVGSMQALVREVFLAPPLEDYVVRLVAAVTPGTRTVLLPEVNQYFRFGPSPRGAQALALGAKVNALLDGRVNVSYDDVVDVVLPALRHRCLLNFQAEAENVVSDQILELLLKKVPRN